MNQIEIGERLVLAVEIESRGNHVGPSPLRAQQLPYVHSEEDMRGWGHRRGDHRSRKRRVDACRLRPEDDDAHAAHRERFFRQVPTDPRSVAEAEEAMGWLTLVENEDYRHALAAWARCMADNRRLFFKDWCAGADISEKTGRKRKDRALAQIQGHLVRSASQNSGTVLEEGLLDEAETGHVDGRIGDAWRADAYSLRESNHILEFDWAAKRNARRRQQEAQRRKAAA